MSTLKRYNWPATAVSPALRTLAPASYGRVAVPPLGLTWRIRFTMPRLYAGQAGYLLSVQGTLNNNPGNFGVLLGLRGGAESVEIYYYQSLLPNPSEGGGTIRRTAVGIANRYKPNTIEVVGTSAGVSARLNDRPPVPLEGGGGIQLDFVQRGLVLGGLSDELYVKGVYDNLLIEKDGVVLVDTDFEDGLGRNKISDNYHVSLVNGAIVYPQPAPDQPPAPQGVTYNALDGTLTLSGGNATDYEYELLGTRTPISDPEPPTDPTTDQTVFTDIETDTF